MLALLADFLPADVPIDEVGVYALIPRSFDRATGEILFVRVAGSVSVLTRPSKDEFFRAIPCDATPVSIDDAHGVLRVHVVDGRVLSVSADAIELQSVRNVLLGTGRLSAVDEREKRRRSEPAMQRVRRTPLPPKRGGYDSLREPESAQAEVVRLPMRQTLPPGILPSQRPPQLAEENHIPPSQPLPSQPVPSSHALAVRAPVAHQHVAAQHGLEEEAEPKRDSIRPPAFSDEIELPPPESFRDALGLRAQLKQLWDRGALDEASQVARVLNALGVADSMERKLAATVPDEPPSFAVPVSAELQRRYLAHEDEDPVLGHLLAALWPAALTMRLKPEPQLGLRPTDEVDFSHPSSVFERLFAHGMRAFGISALRLFVRNDVPGGLAHLSISPIGSLAGRTLVQGFGRSESLHVIGGHLWFYRPELYLFALLPNSADILSIVCAGLALERRMPPDPRIVPVAQQLERFMVQDARAALSRACGSLSLPGDPRTSMAAALTRYRRAAYLGAVRAGLLLSGSLEASLRTQRLMPAIQGISTEETIDDLLSYASSSAWFSLRHELGIDRARELRD